jgi:hypothetical protein
LNILSISLLVSKASVVFGRKRIVRHTGYTVFTVYLDTLYLDTCCAATRITSHTHLVQRPHVAREQHG